MEHSKDGILIPVDVTGKWREYFQSDFAPYLKKVESFLETDEVKQSLVFPKVDEYFAAFKETPFEDVKVVILGQDPYHGEGQAHGLCFSVRPGVKPPPSLVNIYKEMQTDIGLDPVNHGYLMSWAQQGVLMLNATLSVEAGRAGSHQKKGWEEFTDQVIQKINSEKSGVAFILWGSYAQKKGERIDESKHFILKSPHPSPLSSYRGFFGSQPFSKVNSYLKSMGKKEIDWSLREDT